MNNFEADTIASTCQIVHLVPIIPFGTASKKHHGTSEKCRSTKKVSKNRDRRFTFPAVAFSLFSPTQFLHLYRQKSLVMPLRFDKLAFNNRKKYNR